MVYAQHLLTLTYLFIFASSFPRFNKAIITGNSQTLTLKEMILNAQGGIKRKNAKSYNFLG